MNKDLTRGPVMRSMLLFAVPMILGNLLQQCCNIADTLIVGQFLGKDALAAVGSSFTLMTFLTSILLGLCMGSGALFSIRFGQRDEKGLREAVWASFVLIAAAALVLNVLAFACLDALKAFLRVPEEVWPLMRAYLAVIFFGIALYAWFRCPQLRAPEPRIEGNAEKNHRQIRPHQRPHLLRNPEKGFQSVQAGKGQHIQHQRRCRNQHEGSPYRLPESLFIPLSEPDGKQGPAAHAQSQQDGGQEGHQRKGGAYGRQRVLPQKLPHNQGVRNIAALLQKVSQNHGHRKQQHGAHHRSPGQVFVHVLTLYLYSSPIVPPIAGRTQAYRRSFPASLSLPRQVLPAAGAVSLPPQKLQPFPAPAAQAAHRMPMAGLPSIDCTRGDEPWLIPTGSCWRG